MKLRSIIVSAALAVFALSLAALGQQAGSASGTLTVNGKVAKLSHAYARSFKNNPEDTEKYIEVLLTAEPVDPLVAGSSSALRHLAAEGKLTGIQVTIAEDKHPSDVVVYSPAISDGYVPAAKNKEFDAETFDDQTVAGRAYTSEEGSFLSDSYEYDVKFRAEIAPDPFSITPADRAALAAMKPGAAIGSFKVNDKETKFQYAYAVGRKEFPGDPEKMVVVLSDAPVPEEVLLGGFGMQKLGAEGTVHAVEVELDKDHKPSGGQLYNKGFYKPEDEGKSMSISVSGMHNFVPEKVDANSVSGKLFMKEPSDFMDSTFHYSALFRADVLRNPPPTYEGAKAPLSGPGKVATSFMSAARLGNKLALKKLVTPPMAAQLDTPEGAMILKMAKASFPLGMNVVEVTEKGDTAEVVAMKRSKSGRETVRLHAIKIAGQWKVGQPGGEQPPAPPRAPPTPEQIALAKTGPGKTLLAFADAIHEKNVAKMKALSADPEEFKGMEGPFAEMALGILSAAFPWDLRITRVTQTGSTALVEAESQQIKEPLKVDMVLIKGVWKIAQKPKQP
ncbi:MAG: hypothetical protein M3O85_02025 [Acidobacteriota bacterium]|nr:hypothetical protein [Acidobacteriota bacterium]